ncbi:AMP-binding protein [Alteromonas naphthalenivorans]|uniref:AMP-binding protein n=1 Tax=Alteromonas naphthalenivorans TaxID=715451 RepID=UPI00130531C5|nr:AMP-binding protein [Alteromonas naphthalenivorans]
MFIEPVNSLAYVDALFKSLNEGLTVEQIAKHNGKHDVIAINQSYGWYEGTAYVPQSSLSTAQILYTSGTTGEPKAVHIAHESLKNTAERLVEVMEMTSEIKEYVGIPVNYSFGFGRCRAISLVDGKFYVPEKFDPLEIVRMLEADEINAISAVPSLWRVLLSFSDLITQELAKKVYWIEIGSQYMAAEEKLKLAELFPNAKIVQHYGLTEASRTTFLKIHEKKALDSVGKTYFDDVSVKISENGRIAIKGPHVTSKICSDKDYLFGKESWFETTDLGEIDNGYVYFKGRDDDVINCGGIKLSPDTLDLALSQKVGVDTSDFTVFKYSDELRGELPAIAISRRALERKNELINALNDELVEKKLNIKSLIKVLMVDELPRTATNKVKRKELYFSDIEGESVLNEESVSDENFEELLVKALKVVLKVNEVGPDDSIKSLGGDSLSTLMLLVKLEKMGLPNDEIMWLVDGLTLKEVIQRKEQKKTLIEDSDDNSYVENKHAFFTTPENLSLYLIRGIFVLINIIAHWSTGLFERMPLFLHGLDRHFAVVFNSGTTGFALMFGLTYGASLVKNKLNDIKTLKSTSIKNMNILLAGIFLLATLRLISNTLAGGQFSAMTVTNSVYSVLYFYFFAVLTFPFIILFLSRYTNFATSIVTTALTFWLLSLYISNLDIEASENSLIQLVILLFTAKYDYLGMSAIALIGALAGYYLRWSAISNKQMLYKFQAGIMLCIAAIYIGISSGEIDMWTNWPTSKLYMSLVFLFVSVIVVLDAIFVFLLQSNIKSRVLIVSFRLLASVGLLAFPLFVLHELVLPSVSILSSLGFESIRLLPFIIFSLLFFVLIRRVYKVI